MQFNRAIRAYSSSFFAIAMASIFLLASGVAQAQCNFFTGWSDNKDGTVTDTRNGLIWKRCAEGFEFNNGVCTGEGEKADWETAMSMAQRGRFLDKSDWRLPTKDEFSAVLGNYDDCKNNQEGEFAASKAIAHMSGYFWSSSPYVGNPAHTWFVLFSNGFVDNINRNVSLYVRLVRAGQGLGGEASLEFVSEITEKEQIETERQTELRRADEGRRRIEASSILKAMAKEEVCAVYGKALRGQEIFGIGELPEIIKLVKKETARRRLKFDDALTRKELVKIGISECQLFASWGAPEDQNRTVGSWGVHTQHVYGSGAYVYTENGRVTSWQD